jgi:hypothetical protein
MIRFALALLLALWLGAPTAQAQNANCPDVPAGDSSNRCANTRFVKSNGGVPGGTPPQVQYNNSGVFGGLTDVQLTARCQLATSTLSGCVAANGVRTKLTGDTTFYVATTGSDVAGCGTAIGNPCHTRHYMYNFRLAGDYDLAGFTPTIQFADGEYNDAFTAYGPLVGQTTSVIFQGNVGNPTAVKFWPSLNTGYAHLVYIGARNTLQYIWGDMIHNFASTGGADIFAVSNPGSELTFGPGMTFGCNWSGYNAVTIAFAGLVRFQNDFSIDTGQCRRDTTATYTNGAGTIVVASATGLKLGMGIVSAGVPSDAYIGGLAGTTVTLGCLSTTPCQNSSSQTGTATIFTAGGQVFIDFGNYGQLYFNTNGDPDFSIKGTLANFAYYQVGWYYVNTLSSANAQAVTWVNQQLASGRCFVVTALSVLDTAGGLMGQPCANFGGNGTMTPIKSATLTAGSRVAALNNVTNVSIGNSIGGVAYTTGTWTAGSTSVVVASATGIAAGNKVIAPGILAGAVVTNVAGTTITIGGCSGTGTKCVTGSPAYLSGAGATTIFEGTGVPIGAYITDISGLNVTMSEPATITGTQSVMIGGQVLKGSIFQ